MLATLARCRELARGLKQEFAVCFEGRLTNELREAGADVHNLGRVRMRFPWQVILARAALGRCIQQRQTDVVILHGSWALGLFGGVVARSGAELVYWMHNDTQVAGKNVIERVAATSRPRVVIANSEFTASTLALAFEEVPPVEVLPCPVEWQPLTEAAEGLPEKTGRVIILQVGRPEPWKGAGLLIEAASRMTATNWEVWLVGGAVTREQETFLEELRDLALARGVVEQVKFLGERNDVPAVMAAADVFCQPNLTPEPFGIVFVEALYAGLPVVSVRHGGVVGIVNRSCGVLVEPGSVDELSAALERLVTQPDERRRLTRVAPARAGAVADPGRILGRLEEILGRVMAGVVSDENWKRKVKR